jgi:ribose/xylose/arabinose/galactoside ABC-type transport system permease subunit
LEKGNILKNQKEIKKNNNILINILSEQSVWILVIIIFVFGGIVSKTFFSVLNISNLFSQSSILGLLALAESVVLITGNFDLTIEQNMVFTASVGGYLVSTSDIIHGPHLNPIACVIIMILVGALLGLINGLLIGYLGMNAFMGTLSMQVTILGLNLFIFHGVRIFPFPNSFTFFGSGKIGPVPFPLIGLIIIFIIFHFILTRTVLGRSLFAVGGNRSAAKVIGVDDKQVICIAYVISGAICGLAGWAIAGRMGSASPNMSTSMLLLAIAAIVIGGVNLNGGSGTIIGIFGGIFLMVAVSNIMNSSRMDPYIINFFVGLTILIVVLIDYFRKNLTDKFK